MKASTTFLLASLFYVLLPGNAQAQCTVQTFTNYAVSSSVAVNDTGTDILTTVVVDGSATMQMSTGCPDSVVTQFNNNKQYITHFPSVLNQIDSVGGWLQGPSFCAECYSSYQTNLDSGPLGPGQAVTFTSEAQVNCSTAGLIFWPPPEIHSYSIRLSAYIFFGLSDGRCTWIPSCAGKCSSQHTTNTFGGLCFTTGPYKQCFDLLRDGACWDYRTFCYGKESAGICTN